MNILDELKAKYPCYLMGKTPKVIEAVIEYLESPIAYTQRYIAEKHGVSTGSIRIRSHEICNMLNLDMNSLLDNKERSRASSTVSCLKCGKQTSGYKCRINLVQYGDEWGKSMGYLCLNCCNTLTKKEFKK